MSALDQGRAILSLSAGFPIGSPENQVLAGLIERAAMFDYVLPLVTGVDSRAADRRTHLLAAGMVVGHDGVALIRWAMEQPQ